MSEIIEILNLFEEIISILSSQNYITLLLVYPFIKKLTEILKKDLKDFDNKTIDENDIETVKLFDLLNDNKNNINFNETKNVVKVIIYETNQSRDQKAKIDNN